MRWLIYSMVYLGSGLMVYNIYGFIRFARYVRNLRSWNRENHILYIPIILLVCFLIGYLVVGIFGKPDLVIAGILFGGSIFVCIMYKLLSGITQRIVENERLQAELLAAEESNQTKTRFLASMSHEMRTPMNVIIGLDAVILREDDSLKPQTRDRLRKIDLSAHHLLDIINDVLNMSYIESNDMRLKEAPFSPREVLELVDLLAREHCAEKQIEYHSEAVGEIDALCVGDSLRLRQILVAVIGNAIKFTPSGGSVLFRTELTGEGEGALRLRFTVRDTGMGISEAYLPRVFDAFSQEDASSTNQHGGSGLGLAIAKKLVDLMNGEISVQSEKGKGSTFEISVRLERANDRQAPGSAAHADVELAGRHILVAEDMDLNAEMIADLLELEGMTSERAENGQKAVERFSKSSEGHFDAILMDMRMPVMDGLSATKEIRTLNRGDARTVPIIALTANASEEEIRQSLQAGMDMHLSKPVDPDLLYDTLKRLLAGRWSVLTNRNYFSEKEAP